jgi:hypothetical protein
MAAVSRFRARRAIVRPTNRAAALGGNTNPPELGRAISSMAGVPRSYRDAQLALERLAYDPEATVLAYEDFDLTTLILGFTKRSLSISPATIADLHVALAAGPRQPR